MLRPFYSVDEKRLAWLENNFLNYLKDKRTHANLRELSGNVRRSLILLTVFNYKGQCNVTKSMITLMKECLGIGAKHVLPQ